MIAPRTTTPAILRTPASMPFGAGAICSVTRVSVGRGEFPAKVSSQSFQPKVSSQSAGQEESVRVHPKGKERMYAKGDVRYTGNERGLVWQRAANGTRATGTAYERRHTGVSPINAPKRGRSAVPDHRTGGGPVRAADDRRAVRADGQGERRSAGRLAKRQHAA